MSELCARLRGGAAMSRTPRGEFAIDDTPHEISGVSLVVRSFAMEMTVPEPNHDQYLLDLLVLQPTFMCVDHHDAAIFKNYHTYLSHMSNHMDKSAGAYSFFSW